MNNFITLLVAQPKLTAQYSWVMQRELRAEAPAADAFGNSFLRALGRWQGVRTLWWWMHQLVEVGNGEDITGVWVGGRPLTHGDIGDVARGQLPWECVRLDGNVMHRKKIRYTPADSAYNLYIVINRNTDKRGYTWINFTMEGEHWRAVQAESALRLSANQPPLVEGNEAKSITLGQLALILGYGQQPEQLQEPGRRLLACHAWCDHSGVANKAHGCCLNSRHLYWGGRSSNAIDRLCTVHALNLVPVRIFLFHDGGHKQPPHSEGSHTRLRPV